MRWQVSPLLSYLYFKHKQTQNYFHLLAYAKAKCELKTPKIIVMTGMAPENKFMSKFDYVCQNKYVTSPFTVNYCFAV